MREGYKYGSLTAIRYVSADAHKNQIWLFRCDCGKECKKRANDVASGKTASCGCKRVAKARENHTKHGEFLKPGRHRLYMVWMGMKQRCSNPNHKQYKYYGARGIAVCSAWVNSFQNFSNWAIENGYDESAPRGQCTIDRIDNDRGYSPDNCRWVDAITQRHNRRDSNMSVRA